MDFRISSAALLRGPEAGERWLVFNRPLTFLDRARNFAEEKLFVFQCEGGKLLVMTKDEFFSDSKRKLL